MEIDDIAYKIYVKTCEKEYADEKDNGYLLYAEKEFFLGHKTDGRWAHFYEQAILILRYVKIKKIKNGNR